MSKTQTMLVLRKSPHLERDAVRVQGIPKMGIVSGGYSLSVTKSELHLELIILLCKNKFAYG